MRRTLDFRLGVYIIIGTIPIGVFGLIFKDQIETGARDLTLIGCTLIALGLLLLLAEKVATHTRGLDSFGRTQNAHHEIRTETNNPKKTFTKRP